jgi:hypothetical protein
MQERPQSGVAALQVANGQWLRGGCRGLHRADACALVLWAVLIAACRAAPRELFLDDRSGRNEIDHHRRD